jgi:hypothetical protein
MAREHLKKTPVELTPEDVQKCKWFMAIEMIKSEELET